jgi:hypothetical protein
MEPTVVGWEDFAAYIEGLSGPLLTAPAQLDYDPNSTGEIGTLRKKVENLSNGRIIANIRNMVQSGQTPCLASKILPTGILWNAVIELLDLIDQDAPNTPLIYVLR